MCIQIQIKVCIFQDESIINLIHVTDRPEVVWRLFKNS